MGVPFLFQCFVVGVVSTLGLGPIFFLTINRSVLHGFMWGIATAFGAACADGFLFAAGLSGVLTLIRDSQQAFLILDLVGGLVLTYIGIYMKNRTVIKLETLQGAGVESIFFVPVKSFLITLFNPGAVLFFTSASMIMLHESITFTTNHIIVGGSVVTLGTLCGLSSISLAARFFGAKLKTQHLEAVSRLTGIGFILFGGYLFIDFIRIMLPISLSLFT